jgi:ABC-type lipoprotein export system ATPase subunit
MALLDRLQAQGNTIVPVTHEHDIAEYAHRVVYIKTEWSRRTRGKRGDRAAVSSQPSAIRKASPAEWLGFLF